MGRDIHVRLVEKNFSMIHKTNIWEEVKLYEKSKDGERYILIDIFPYRNYELFDILSGTRDSDNFHSLPIRTEDLPKELTDEITSCRNSIGYYSFAEINLADLKLYLMQYPKTRDYDYDEDDPKAYKDNPVKFFIERIEQYLDFSDPFWDFGPASDIRVLYWFDC